MPSTGKSADTEAVSEPAEPYVAVWSSADAVESSLSRLSVMSLDDAAKFPIAARERFDQRRPKTQPVVETSPATIR